MVNYLQKTDDYIFRIGVIIAMMLTTIMEVEIRWAECEIIIFHGIPMLLVLGVALLIWKKHKLQVTLTDTLAIGWFLYYIGRVWIGNEWPCQMEFLKTVELFSLYFSLRIVFAGTKLSAWALIGSILIFGCYEAGLGASQLFGDGISRHYRYSISGNFLNPGPYSAYLMLGVIIGLVAIKEVPKQTIISAIPKFVPTKISDGLKTITWKHLLIIAVVVMAILLPATWSRAAFLGLVVVLLYVYREEYRKYRYIVWGCILLAGIAFYFIKQGSADGRVIIWRSALTTWTNYPWLGVGVGGFFNAFAEGTALLSVTDADFSSAGVPDGAYNNFLRTIVEQGIVGGLFVTGFTISALIKLSKNSKPLFYGIIALLIFSMFSYPFDLMSYKVIVVMIIAWSESIENKRLIEIESVMVFLLGVFLSLTCWYAGKIANESFKRDQELETGRSFWNFCSNEKVYEWLTYEGDNNEFLFSFGKMLREEGRFNDSNAILRQGTKCSADPMFYVLMGNNYKDMRHYDMAEQAYQKAFSVMPNRLYPLYQLMMLYHDSGNIKKAKTMAKRVIEMKPKIESPATKDMKKKAMEII